MINRISDKELLAIASEFNIGPEPLPNGHPFWWEYFSDDTSHFSVRVKNMGSRNTAESVLWAILSTFGCLNKLGEREYQSSPSNRDDDFYERCRYASVHEAILYYRRWKAAVEGFAIGKASAIGLDISNSTARAKLTKEDIKKIIVNYDEIPAEILKF